jgi:hypothetical protein
VRALRILTRLLLFSAGLVLPVILLAAYWYLTACLYAESGVPQLVNPAYTLRLDFGLLLILGFVALFYDANAYSLHQFYKDRLSKAFLFEPDSNKDVAPDNKATGVPNDEVSAVSDNKEAACAARKAATDPNDKETSDPKPLLNFKLSSIETHCSPYHILNAALNVQGSKEANRRGRNADFFTFTRDFVGSDLTHFAATKDHDTNIGIERIEPRLDLGAAMAISGAAVSANMGSDTVRWLSPTLALLNVRLGYWLRNPRDLGNEVSLFRPKEWLNAIWGKFYLILEMLNQLDEEKTFVYLSDGGHIENLGIYQLLKRGCRLIIAVDAEADPEISCSSLLKLERYARIDLGVRIILPWEYIRERYRETSDAIDPHTPKEAKRYRGPHCAIGRILYEDGNYGVLLYFKSSLSGDEKDYIIDYKKRYPDFPHENTSDQFFTEEQFEVYRALGCHVVEGYFSNSDDVAFLNDGHRSWPDIHAAKAEITRALGWE